MKIGEISPFFPPFPGGLEVHCKMTCDYLSEIKTNLITVVTTDYPKVNGRFIIEKKWNLKIVRMPLTFNIYNNPFCIGLFFRLFKANFDVFHVQGYWSFYNIQTAAVCFIRRKPMVVTFHGYQEGIVEKFGILGRLTLFTYLNLTGWLYRKVIKAITCNHERDKNILIQMGYKPERIHIIPSGIQVNRCGVENETLASFKKERGITSNNVILFIGRLIRRKGANHLVEIVKEIKNKLDDILLLVIGDGELYGFLENAIKSNQLEGNIKLIGYVKPFSKDLELFFRSSKVFVLPSICESMPRTILEAISYCVPVVTSNLSFNEWLAKKGEESAMLAEPNDITDYARKIVEILKNNSLRTRMIENGMKLIQNYEFDWATISKKLTSLFAEIISDKSNLDSGIRPLTDEKD